MLGAYYFGQPYLAQGPDLVIDATIAAVASEIIKADVSVRRLVAMGSAVRGRVSATTAIRGRVDIEVER